MSGFGRSFKPSYLAKLGGRRPTMPGRTLSNSSETSNQSPSSEPAFFSGSNTPTSERVPEGGTTNLHAEHQPTTPTSPSSTAHQSSRSCLSRFNNSRPINIELPQVKKFKTSPVTTPPAPLSARGDLPGGYFPLHEDPDIRVQRPHPFHSDNKKARQQPTIVSAPAENPTITSTNQVQHHIKRQSPTMTAGRVDLHTPVTSYLPTGANDLAMPMGKYYPSNYESRISHQTALRQNSSSSSISTTHSGQQTPRSESEAKSRLQQYQRDIMTQTIMAAARTGRTPGSTTPASTSSPIKGQYSFGSTVIIGISTPISPRLHPLGSPGPVTPMNLEEEGDYLSKGQRIPGIDAAGSAWRGQARGQR